MRKTAKLPSEPSATSIKKDSDLIYLLSWYHANKENSDAYKYLAELIKREFKLDLTAAELRSTPLTIGFLSRIITLNEDLRDRFLPRIEQEVLRIKKQKLQKKNKENVITSKVLPKQNVQENIKNELYRICSQIDEKLDESIDSGKSHDFDLFFRKNNIKHQYIPPIIKTYKKQLNEFVDLLNEKDEQLTEAYKHLSRQRVKHTISTLQQLIKSAESWLYDAKTIALASKRTQTRKQKPAGVQVAKLYYLKEYENLKSVLPSKIVGATQLWVYNVRYKTLGVYICSNNHGFTVKGSTIQNFDVKESIVKVLRKPEEVLPQVLEAGKVALKKILPALKTKEKKLTGRINKDTILLRVI
jgi:hypothetical protein